MAFLDRVRAWGRPQSVPPVIQIAADIAQFTTAQAKQLSDSSRPTVIPLSGERVLIAHQPDARLNGIYRRLSDDAT